MPSGYWQCEQLAPNPVAGNLYYTAFFSLQGQSHNYSQGTSGHRPRLVVFNFLKDSALEQVDVVVDKSMVLILPLQPSEWETRDIEQKQNQFLTFLCVCLQLWRKKK